MRYSVFNYEIAFSHGQRCRLYDTLFEIAEHTETILLNASSNLVATQWLTHVKRYSMQKVVFKIQKLFY